MKATLAILAALSLVSASPTPQWEETNVPHIVGGVLAQVGNFPSIVSLQWDGLHNCGGSLLDSKTVVTAAHCVYGVNVTSLTVRAGSLDQTSGGILASVTKFYVHPAYNASSPTNYDSDIAVIKLKTPIRERWPIRYATLAPKNPGTIAWTAGWGLSSLEPNSTVERYLRKVDVPIIERQRCRDLYSYNNLMVTENMVCAMWEAGGKDSCFADSGGPLVDAKGRLIGLVSWGVGRAGVGDPGVYVRVGSLRAWIDKFL